MIQINDDFYEDLTAEKTVQLLDALKAAADSLPAQAPMWDEPAWAARKARGGKAGSGSKASGAQVPRPGPVSGRQTCENSAGLTCLTGPKWGPEVVRKDL